MNKIKWITTADWHLMLDDPLGKVTQNGINSRLQEKLKIIEDISKKAVDEKVDFIVFNGDIFNMPNPSSKLRYYLYKAINKLFHNNIKIFFVGGNHDSEGTFNALMADELLLKSYFGEDEYNSFFVVTYPTIFDIENVKFGFLPYYRYSNEKFSEALGYLKDCSILFSHLQIIGATDNNNNSLTSGIEQEKIKNFKKVYLGHLHIPQSYQNYTYCGSPYHTDFGSPAYPKGFILSTISDPLKNFIQEEFINTSKNDRRFFNIQILEHNQDAIFDLNKYEDSIIKLKIKGNEQWVSTINSRKIVKNFKESGAHLVFIDTEIEKEEREDNNELKSTETTSLKYNVINFAKHNKKQDFVDKGIEIIDTADKEINTL
jgi:DNA repair exonuclease SbcCD nuclease subunit